MWEKTTQWLPFLGGSQTKLKYLNIGRISFHLTSIGLFKILLSFFRIRDTYISPYIISIGILFNSDIIYGIIYDTIYGITFQLNFSKTSQISTCQVQISRITLESPA